MSSTLEYQKKTKGFLIDGWTTHLKNMLVKLDHETPGIGVNIPKIFEVSPPRYYMTFTANL